MRIQHLNHTKIGAKINPQAIILHTDLGSYEGTKNVILNLPTKVSYNYYVKKNGDIVEYVPSGYTAWHAGRYNKPITDFFGGKNPNSMSIGICFEGRGELANEKQKESIKELIKEFDLPIFAHKEVTIDKPQAPLDLANELRKGNSKGISTQTLLTLIQILKKLGILKD